MAYDELLADRIKSVLDSKRISYEEKKMFGGLCFMVDDKMCLGVEKDRLMARIGPDAYEDALTQKGCQEMTFTGRPMKGFVFVEDEGLDLDEDLEFWVDLCLAYNPIAKSSKKKKK